MDDDERQSLIGTTLRGGGGDSTSTVQEDDKTPSSSSSSSKLQQQLCPPISLLWDFESLGYTPDMLWVSNWLTPSLLFAYRTFLVVYLILMMTWSSVEHKEEAKRLYLHLTNYSHLLFAAYLKFGVFFSGRAAFYEVKPMCERDALPEPATEWRWFPYKFAWTLLELAFTWSLVLVCMHWLLYTHDGSTLNNAFLSVHNRGGLFTLVCIDLILCRVEFIPAHQWVNLIAVTILLAMNVVYTLVTGRTSYYFLDFKKLPFTQIVTRVLIIYALFAGAFWFGLYMTRGRNQLTREKWQGIVKQQRVDDTDANRPQKKKRKNSDDII